MSDRRLRELERRWRETGAPADRAAYLRELTRLGVDPPGLTLLHRVEALAERVAEHEVRGEALAHLARAYLKLERRDVARALHDRAHRLAGSGLAGMTARALLAPVRARLDGREAGLEALARVVEGLREGYGLPLEIQEDFERCSRLTRDLTATLEAAFELEGPLDRSSAAALRAALRGLLGAIPLHLRPYALALNARLLRELGLQAEATALVAALLEPAGAASLRAFHSQFFPEWGTPRRREELARRAYRAWWSDLAGTLAALGSPPAEGLGAVLLDAVSSAPDASLDIDAVAPLRWLFATRRDGQARAEELAAALAQRGLDALEHLVRLAGALALGDRGERVLGGEVLLALLASAKRLPAEDTVVGPRHRVLTNLIAAVPELLPGSVGLDVLAALGRDAWGEGQGEAWAERPGDSAERHELVQALAYAAARLEAPGALALVEETLDALVRDASQGAANAPWLVLVSLEAGARALARLGQPRERAAAAIARLALVARQALAHVPPEGRESWTFFAASLLLECAEATAALDGDVPRSDIQAAFAAAVDRLPPFDLRDLLERALGVAGRCDDALGRDLLERTCRALEDWPEDTDAALRRDLVRRLCERVAG